MAHKYYVKDSNDKVTGPYSAETLRSLAKDGKIPLPVASAVIGASTAVSIAWRLPQV